MKPPITLKSYCWDTNFAKLDSDADKDYLIQRLLEYGDLDAFVWLQKQYSKTEIVRILKTGKQLSAKTGNFFAHYYKLNPKELICIRKPFTRKQDRF